MKACQCVPGAETGAESAEVRKARNGEGSRAVVKCGKSAERVRKHSVPIPLAPSSGPDPSPTLAQPLALVRTQPENAREMAPAPQSTPRRNGWPLDTPPSLARGLPAPEQAVIDAALAILTRRVREPGAVVDSPGVARELVRLHLAQCGRERFAVLFLDARHAFIEFEVLFEGTLSQTSVHPREVVRRALQLNAAAVILAHNHPGGTAVPSLADEYLTQSLRAALALVDVRVLDHLVVGWPAVCSMSELGLVDPMPAPSPARRKARAAGAIVRVQAAQPTLER